MTFIKGITSLLLGAGIALVLWVAAPSRLVLAQEPANEFCLACHGQPGQQTTLPSGEVLYLTVDPRVYDASVHGQQDMRCIQCHADASQYPHPPLTASSRRELSLAYYRSSCIQCHRDKYDATLDGVHQIALAGGNTQAAICTDCHGTHNIQPPSEPRSRSSQMCALCHSEIFERYKSSVHGAALIGEGNPDVPTCVDCHRVHNIEGPHTGAFHLFSPQLCATCHADPEMMEPYGISTDVFDTYVSDFHGTTVLLFQALAPDQETNKPVCIDCHGVHDMKQVDDPESAVMKENLLSTCQKCHPDATANFPTSWISHYRPDPQHVATVYYVQLFYEVFIPVLIVGMLLFVASDAYRRFKDRNKKAQRHVYD
jgi:nitrate/TMAO reductase-like tetraheme cytochrome c subunit